VERSILVVGAGLAGASCARRLVGAGRRVLVVDKARGAGGRASTARRDDLRFDHGAQYFTVRDPRFATRVEAWRDAGAAAPWAGPFVRLAGGGPEPSPGERFVGVPGMSALARAELSALPPDALRFEARVARLERSAGGWTAELEGGERLGPFGAAVVTAPAPQAAPLLGDGPLAAAAAAARLAPCWAALVELEEPLDPGWAGAFVRDAGPLAWIGRNETKPGRPARPAWTLHAAEGWSEAHLEDDPGDVGPALLVALAETLGRPLPAPRAVRAHRWRYARTVAGPPDFALFDPAAGLGVCGDWTRGDRVEGAVTSGLEVAEALLEAEP